MVDDIESLRRRAKAMALAGRWDSDAIELNRRIIECDECDADAYTRVARCFLEQGRFLAAREHYEQVLRFDPSNQIARNNLKRLRNERFDRVDLELVARIADYNEAFLLGITARRAGRHSVAIAALNRACEIEPENIYALNALGAAYRHAGQLRQAADTYERALRVRSNPVSLVGRAAVAREQKDPKHAVSLCRDALVGTPRDAYALSCLGGAYADLGLIEQAVTAFADAASLAAGRDTALESLRDLRRRCQARGDTESARRIASVLERLDGR